MAVKKVPVIQQDPERPVEVPILAQAILDISNGAKKALSSGLSRKAIIVLIHHHSKIPMRDVEIVLNNITSLQETWLQKRS
jgi:hypothetical protein